MEKILNQIREILGENLTSLMHYQRFNEDLLIIVLREADIQALIKIRKPLKKTGFIVFLEHDLGHGEDVFPLEYLHMQTHVDVIEGKDYFASMKLKKTDIRTQLEYELRNKLIHLRQDFLIAPNQKTFLKKILPQFVVFLEALFFLKNITPTRDFEPDIQVIEDEYNIDLTAFQWLLRVEQGVTKLHKSQITDMIQSVHDQLESLLHIINKLKI